MNLLTDCLPTSLMVGGRAYQIRTSFRTWIDWELTAFECPELDEQTKAVRLLGLCFEGCPEDLETAYGAMLAFYACESDTNAFVEKMKSADAEAESRDEAPAPSPKRVYSFNHDAGEIYAAFLTQYGIDLTDPELNLHWWLFKALFHSLEEGHAITKMMNYRGADLNDVSEYERPFYRRMKRMYALPDIRSEEEKERDLYSAMGDLFE